MTLDLPTPPLPLAMPMTVVALPSWNGDGRSCAPRPARRPRRSSSLITSMVTWTVSTPGSGARASVTRRWISAFSGQPATVSRMATATRPSRTSTSPTIPRSTIERCSSGSCTSRKRRERGVAGRGVAHMNIRA